MATKETMPSFEFSTSPESMSSPEPSSWAMCAVFAVLRVDGPEAADGLVKVIGDEYRRRVRHEPDFVSARVHIGADGLSVVNRVQWVRARGCPSPRERFAHGPDTEVLRDLIRRPGVVSGTFFHGAPAPGLQGPEAHLSDRPGVVAVATRHLDGTDESFRELMDLLTRSGEWKRGFPGFISATPYIDPDRKTFINYPMWADERAYRAWMADPRISEGQEEIARLEVAPPEYLLCTVADQVDAA